MSEGERDGGAQDVCSCGRFATGRCVGCSAPVCQGHFDLQRVYGRDLLAEYNRNLRCEQCATAWVAEERSRIGAAREAALGTERDEWRQFFGAAAERLAATGCPTVTLGSVTGWPIANGRWSDGDSGSKFASHGSKVRALLLADGAVKCVTKVMEEVRPSSRWRSRKLVETWVEKHGLGLEELRDGTLRTLEQHDTSGREPLSPPRMWSSLRR